MLRKVRILLAAAVAVSFVFFFMRKCNRLFVNKKDLQNMHNDTQI